MPGSTDITHFKVNFGPMVGHLSGSKSIIPKRHIDVVPLRDVSLQYEINPPWILEIYSGNEMRTEGRRAGRTNIGGDKHVLSLSRHR